MKNKKHSTYQQKYILELNAKIKVLEKENESLKNINSSLNKSIDNARQEHDKALKTYTDGLKEINKLKSDYKKLINSVYVAKKIYSDKTKELLMIKS